MSPFVRLWKRVTGQSFDIDYDKAIGLDAEDLAEGGIKRAYDGMRVELSKYLPKIDEIEEEIVDHAPYYTVRCAGVEYVLYSPDSRTNIRG